MFQATTPRPVMFYSAVCLRRLRSAQTPRRAPARGRVAPLIISRLEVAVRGRWAIVARSVSGASMSQRTSRRRVGELPHGRVAIVFELGSPFRARSVAACAQPQS
eukprot:9234951-Alexandrium_andersonii.AAC.1